jgi:hypothetical protein
MHIYMNHLLTQSQLVPDEYLTSTNEYLLGTWQVRPARPLPPLLGLQTIIVA